MSASTVKNQWLSSLQSQIAAALANSALVRDIDTAHISTGKTICQELWPFIRELPENISQVRSRLPADLEPARKFLGQLADDERHYQGLYLKQCQLAGLKAEELLETTIIPEHSRPLVEAMRRYCSDGTVAQGVEAIVTAELAASSFARVVLASFESYFAENSATYGAENIEEGLRWLRFHAKPNIRHALWMKKMLDAFDQENPADQSKNLPLAVTHVLDALFVLWRTSGDLVQK